MKIFRNFLWGITGAFLVLSGFLIFPNGIGAQTIKIGLVSVITGPTAKLGEDITRGAKLAVEEVNKAGGIQGKKIDLIIEDDSGKPDVGVNAITKLVRKDKVFVLLGPYYSGVTFPSMFICQEASVPQLTSSLAPKITQQKNPWIFRLRPNDDTVAKILVQYMLTNLNLKKIALMNVAVEYGISGIEAAEKYLKISGVPGAARVSYNFGDKDFTAQISRVKESGAEAILNWGLPVEAALIAKQLRQLGYKGLYIGGTGLDDHYVELAQDAAEGSYSVTNFSSEDPDPIKQDFTKKYRTRWNSIPDRASANYYQGIYLIKHIVEKTGVDPVKFRDFLHQLKGWKGMQGTYSYDDNGDCGTFQTIVKVQKGKFTVVYTNP